MRLRLATLACALMAVFTMPGSAWAGWVDGDMGSPAPYVSALLADPGGDALWAATTTGLWHSADAGATWARIDSAGTSALRGAAVGAGDPWVLGGDGVVQHSTDGGASWSSLPPLTPNPGSIVADPATGDAYVSAWDTTAGRRVARVVGSAYIAWDQGLTPSAHVDLVGVDPSTHRVVTRDWSGRLWVRTPLDASWTLVPNNPTWGGAALDASTNPATLVTADESHLNRSTDLGATSTSRPLPVAGPSGYSYRLAAGSGRVAFAASGGDGASIAVTSDGGDTWATYAVPTHSSIWALALAADGTIVANGAPGAIAAPALQPPASAPVLLDAPWARDVDSARVHGTFTSGKGRWWGTTDATVSVQWERCDADPLPPANCTPIADATGTGYSSTWADARHSVRIAVTALGPTASTTATSNLTYVAAIAPESVAPPTLAGQPVVGQTLTVTPATWLHDGLVDGAGLLACHEGHDDCRPVTGTSFVLTPADRDHEVLVVEWVENDQGSGFAESAAVGPVVDPPPVTTEEPALPPPADPPAPPAIAPPAIAPPAIAPPAIAPPAIAPPAGTPPPLGATPTPPRPARPAAVARPRVAGTLRPGHTVRCTRGSWTGEPEAFSYRWLRQGRLVPGTSKTYKVRAANRGKLLACRVSARNRGGTATATSAAVRVPARVRM